MAAVVEFAVTISDVLGGAVGPLAFARDSLERAVSAALPGGAPMLQGLHVRGGGSDGGAGGDGAAAESAPPPASELREEGGSSPEAPAPDTAAPAHDAAALVVQATADGAASMHALRSAVLSGEFGLALGRALNAEPRLDEPRLAPGDPNPNSKPKPKPKPKPTPSPNPNPNPK